MRKSGSSIPFWERKTDPHSGEPSTKTAVLETEPPKTDAILTKMPVEIPLLDPDLPKIEATSAEIDTKNARWHCRWCEQPLVIEAIEPSSDGSLLTLWHCDACLTSGITPAEVQTPPAGVTVGHVCSLFPGKQPGEEDVAQPSDTPPSVVGLRRPAEQVELLGGTLKNSHEAAKSRAPTHCRYCGRADCLLTAYGQWCRLSADDKRRWKSHLVAHNQGEQEAV